MKATKDRYDDDDDEGYNFPEGVEYAKKLENSKNLTAAVRDSWRSELPPDLQDETHVIFEPGDRLPLALVADVYDAFGSSIGLFNDDDERIDPKSRQEKSGFSNSLVSWKR